MGTVLSFQASYLAAAMWRRVLLCPCRRASELTCIKASRGLSLFSAANIEQYQATRKPN